MRNATEALFDAIVTEGWANRSDGSVESPTGHFAHVTIEPRELREIMAAFGSVTDAYGMPEQGDIIGHFIVTTDDQGFIGVTRYPTEASAVSEFATLQSRYNVWMES